MPSKTKKLSLLIKNHFLLIVIILFATVLHFYKLGQIPRILNPDEASIGYNALLLRQTGKDEWGKTWPLVLDAFGDQKLIGYPGLVVLAFQIFGMSDWAVKLPSLIAGSILILLMYVIQFQLGVSKKQATLAAALIAIVPVFFFYSRVAFEAMVALAYLMGGFSLLLAAKKLANERNVIISTLFAILLFMAALLTYNSPIILVPFIMIAVVMDRGILKWRKWLGVVSVVGAVWLIFVILFLPLTQQKSKITLFGDETTLNDFGRYRAQFSGSAAQTLLGNKYIFYSERMASNYLKSWAPGFLIYNVGGHPWHTMPGFGYLNWTIYATGLIGITAKLYFLLKGWRKGKNNSREWAVLFLFLFSLAPVIITVNAPQATRSLLFFFLWCYYSAFGILLLCELAKKLGKNQVMSKIVMGTLCFLIVIETVNYWQVYFGNYAQSLAMQSMFQPGLDKLVQKVDKEDTQPLAIVDERGFNYILVAWYLKMQPEYFFTTVKKQLPDKINFKYGEQVGRYHFIAKATDRKTTEKTVLEWNASSNLWDELKY